MLVKQLSLLAFAGQALSQSVPNLLQALSGSGDILSALSGVLDLVPSLVDQLGNTNNITILAPSNVAFSKLGNTTLAGLAANPALLTAILQYHVLNGTIYASEITKNSTFVPTHLTSNAYTNVTGGQRVQAESVNGTVTFYSGLNHNSTVTQANVNFTGGVIHVIDNLLSIPENISATATAANLTSLVSALNATNLVDTIDTTHNLTVFAPNNAAFQAINSTLASLSVEEITKILTYHAVVAQEPLYSTTLKNGTMVKTLNGANLTITMRNGSVYVNNAKVVKPNVLVANGVVHVIDSVLNPNKTGAATESSASKAAAQAMQTGSVGLGAVLGAAAVFFL